MSSTWAGFGYTKDGGTKKQDIPFPWCCPSLSLTHITALHIRVVFTEAAHTALAGSQPTEWLQLLHINMVTEAIGRGQREKMEGVASFAQPALLSSTARRQLSKKPACSHGTSTEALSTPAPAVPSNTGYNLVQNNKKQTDRHPPSLPGSCHCANSKVFTSQPDPASSASPQQAWQGAPATWSSTSHGHPTSGTSSW